jgi:hypothetical protein
MRPEISDEVQEMVEDSSEYLLDNPALSTDDMTFEQKIKLVCVNWWQERGEFSNQSTRNAPWNK